MDKYPNLDILTEQALRDVRSAVKTAFDLGVRWGRHEASEEMKARLAAALNINVDPPQADGPETERKIEKRPLYQRAPVSIDEQISSIEPHRGSRAPRGSVRPAILTILTDPLGLTQTEIVQKTGINVNSVRGMLNTLRNEGLAIRAGDHWTLTDAGDQEIWDAASDEQSTEADEKDTRQVPSAASVEQEFG